MLQPDKVCGEPTWWTYKSLAGNGLFQQSYTAGVRVLTHLILQLLLRDAGEEMDAAALVGCQAVGVGKGHGRASRTRRHSSKAASLEVLVFRVVCSWGCCFIHRRKRKACACSRAALAE